MRIEFDAEFRCQALCVGRRLQSNGQYHHIELFLFHPIVGCGIPYGDILAFRVFTGNGCVASYESDARKPFRPFKVSLKILAKGADIVVEYRALGFRVMLLGQKHLLLGIGAAYR